MEPQIELSKTRDFGEIIADSFLFIRQNLKPFLSSFFVFCGFFLLVGCVTGIMQQIRMSNIYAGTYVGDAGKPFNNLASAFTISTILAVFFSLLTYIAMPVTVISFMALYKQKGNIAPTNEEVWGYFKYYFLKVLGGSIVNAIVFIVGFVMCIIPGIYFYPILGLIFPIMIVENTSYGYAFNQSFRLIKENWWTTFGALFITYLIAAICMGMVTVPFQVANFWEILLRRGTHQHLSMVSIVLGTILQQLSHVLYTLPLVAIVICYFSLTEAKDATGLMGRINQLGTNAADADAPAEEY
jgi:hypothetical protein